MKLLLASLLSSLVVAQAPVTVIDKLNTFKAADFKLNLLDNPKAVKGDGGVLSSMNVKTLPALSGFGISLTLITLEPCGMNLPHVHPRASEVFTVVEGENISVGFIAENGGNVEMNTLTKGEASFFPVGAIHFQLNNDCTPATMVAALNHEDPGVLTVAANFFLLDDGAIMAALNQNDEAVFAAMKGAIPKGGAPALSAACRARCNLGQPAATGNGTEVASDTLPVGTVDAEAEDGDGEAEDGDGEAEDGDEEAEDSDGEAEDGDGNANGGDMEAEVGQGGQQPGEWEEPDTPDEEDTDSSPVVAEETDARGSDVPDVAEETDAQGGDIPDVVEETKPSATTARPAYGEKSWEGYHAQGYKHKHRHPKKHHYKHYGKNYGGYGRKHGRYSKYYRGNKKNHQ